MSLGARMRSWMRFVFRRSRAEDDMDAELRFHIEAHAAEMERRGIPHDEALRRARLAFGGVDRAKEECREARGISFIEVCAQDLRYAIRTLIKSSAFTGIAVSTLALAIGANTAIFSVVYAVLLKPLPYPNPDQLVRVFESKLQEGVKGAGTSYRDFEQLRAQNHVFSEVAGSAGHALTLTGQGDPDDVPTEVVSPEIFELLGVKPILGRGFSHEEGERGAAPVAILSEKLWRERFGADPNLLGSSITLDKRPFTVIGVMPADFRTPNSIEGREIWIPIAQDPLFSGFMTRSDGHFFALFARMRPGVTIAQAQAEVDTIAARLAREWPAERSGWTIGLVSLQEDTVGDVRLALLVLLGAVGLVLLIASANVANLLLTRATSRSREMGIRIALGAGRSRILRQLLTESAVLGLLGGVLGACLAYWGVQTLVALLPPGLPRAQEIRVDGWVLGFALALSLAASFAFGLAPALFAADANVQASLKDGSGLAGQTSGRKRARNILATAEIALAMVLLVASGLLIRSFEILTSVKPGFDPARLVKAEISLPQFEYSKPAQWTAFSNELLARIQSEPGLQDSAIAVPLPLANGRVNLDFDIEGNPPPPPGMSRTADFVAVSPDYFRVMRIPLLRGRWFKDEDFMSAPRVTVISDALAHLYFPNQNPIGKTMIFGFPPNGSAPREIVGIVGDVRDRAMHQEPGPMMYVPFAQAPFWGGEVVVRTNLSVASVATTIRKDVRAIDKDLPVTGVETMPEALEASVAQPRFRTLLLSLFGALALVLAAAGIYGVISYSVSSRTREIGIRMALGATPRNVLQLILAESARPVIIGLVIGTATTLVIGQVLSSLLFGVRSTDPLTFVGVATILAGVALAAAYMPTRRAMRVDPMIALRYE